MDNATPPLSWVERTVIEMKASDDYQSRIHDEDYQTLPVPAWNAQRNWLVIGFGVNTRTGGPLGKVQSRAPHIACIIEWPQAKLHWSVDNTAQRAWPAQSGLPNPVIPTGLSGTLAERMRRYYRALSDALEQGAFSGQAPANLNAACVAAREARDAFLPASPYPNLAPFYATPLQGIDDWLAMNCTKP